MKRLMSKLDYLFCKYASFLTSKKIYLADLQPTVEPPMPPVEAPRVDIKDIDTSTSSNSLLFSHLKIIHDPFEILWFDGIYYHVRVPNSKKELDIPREVFRELFSRKPSLQD